MTRFLDELVILAASRSHTLPGAWVRVTLGMSRRNDFNLLAGPADPDGRIAVPAEALETEIEKIRDLFLMDYAGLDAWDGSIRVAVLSREDVERALSAADIWGWVAGVRSKEELRALREFGKVLQDLAGEELTVRVTVRPEDAATLIEEVSEA